VTARRGVPGFATSPASPRARVVAGVVLVAIVAVCLLLARHHPESFAFAPRCPSKMIGLECPGCGSTRATHHLLNGRWGEAWRHNPAALLLGLPFFAILVVDLLTTIVAGRRTLLVLGRGTGIALAVALVAWMVMRNLPGEAFDGWRPPPERPCSSVRTSHEPPAS
jgi:hypothetical protein